MQKLLAFSPLFLLMALLLLSSCGGNGNRGTGGDGDSIVHIHPEATLAFVTVVFPDSAQPRMEVPVSWGRNLGKVLPSLPGIKVGMKSYPGLGRLVNSINGFENNVGSDRYWQFCINGTVADKGVDDIELEDGDEVIWYFVPFNELPCKKIGE